MSTEPHLLETIAYCLAWLLGLIVCAWLFNAWFALGPVILAIIFIFVMSKE